MPAVVTDQFRIANAGNFVDSVLDSSNSYYVFLGLPNPMQQVLVEQTLGTRILQIQLIIYNTYLTIEILLFLVEK